MRLWVAMLLLAVPSVASAQNVTAVDVTAPAALVAGRSAAIDVTVAADAGASPINVSGQLVFIQGGRLATSVPFSVFGPTSIARGGQTVLNLTPVVPAGVDGVYQVAVRLDPANAIAETNELDNTAFTAMYSLVRPAAADGSATAVAFNETALLVGSSLNVDVTVRNDGELSQSFEVAVYASRDAQISPTDVELGRTTMSVGVGAEVADVVAANLPADLNAGDYHIGVIVDPDGTVTEVSEANNILIAAESVNVFWDTLTFDTADVAPAILTVSYYEHLEASGGDGAYVFTLSSGDLPDGLRLDRGTIVGVPSRTGRFDFELAVASNGLQETRALSIDVISTDAPLRIATREASRGFKDLQYSQILVAGGGEGPYAWSLSDGVLPPGLDLTTAGVINGIPNQIGTFGFEVTVEDFLGERDVVPLEIEVVFASQVLVLAGALDPVTVDVPLDLALSAVGGLPPYTWTALTGPPPGLTLTEEGHLVGTPNHVGVFKMRVRATDSTRVESEDSALVELTVQDDGQFEIVTKTFPVAFVRAPYEVIVEASGGLPPLKWRLAPGTSLPAGFFITPGDGTDAPEGTLRVYGVGFNPVDQPLILRVEDAAGRRQELPYVLTVIRGTADGNGDTGCVCVAPAEPTSAAWLLVGLACLALRRRR